MRTFLISSVFALCTAGFLAAGVARAQGDAKPTAAVTFAPRQLPGEIRAAKLIGVAVQKPTGETVGNVNDVVFTAGGQVTAYIIGVGGFLGVAEKNVAVLAPALTIVSDGAQKRTVTLDVTRAALEAAPAYVSERTAFETIEDKAADLAAAASKTAKDLKDRVMEPK